MVGTKWIAALNFGISSGPFMVAFIGFAGIEPNDELWGRHAHKVDRNGMWFQDIHLFERSTTCHGEIMVQEEVKEPRNPGRLD